MTTLKEWLNEPPGGAAALRAEKALSENKVFVAFDPRTEVSADAKYIVRSLVLWFLVVPVAIAAVVWLISR